MDTDNWHVRVVIWKGIIPPLPCLKLTCLVRGVQRHHLASASDMTVCWYLEALPQRRVRLGKLKKQKRRRRLRRKEIAADNRTRSAQDFMCQTQTCSSISAFTSISGQSSTPLIRLCRVRLIGSEWVRRRGVQSSQVASCNEKYHT